MNITVALIENQLLVRIALKGLLESFGGITVITDTDTGQRFLDSISELSRVPDVCIICSTGYMTKDIEAVREMKKKFGTINVMVMASHFHELTIAKLLYEKVDGFLLKSADPKELKKAVLVVHKIGTYWPQSLQAVLSEISNANYTNVSISQKYFQFLELCLEDLTYHEIGRKMGISIRIIDGYRDTLFKKCKVGSRLSLVMFAIRNGIIELK